MSKEQGLRKAQVFSSLQDVSLWSIIHTRSRPLCLQNTHLIWRQWEKKEVKRRQQFKIDPLIKNKKQRFFIILYLLYVLYYFFSFLFLIVLLPILGSQL